MGVEHDQAAAETRLEDLFETYYGDLVRYATRRVGADAAGDVVSATFLTAWRRLADVPDDHARAWLYATARNVIANELRGRGRRERLEDRARSDASKLTPDHAGAVVDRLRVRAVLESLAERDQEVLRLTEWEGLGIDDAAVALGCSRTAAKVRLHRARTRFAARLAEQDDEPKTGPAPEPGSVPVPEAASPMTNSKGTRS